MNEKIYEDSIILIGPSGAGKTTIAKEIEKKTGLPRLPLDIIAKELRRNSYLMEQFASSDEFNEFLIVNTVEKVSQPGVCDFGGGHSIFADYNIYARVKKVLSPFQNIILLLPSEDIENSLNVLNGRTTSKMGKLENYRFLKSPCNKDLATEIIYTEGKTPEEITKEILQIRQKKKNMKDNKKFNI